MRGDAKEPSLGRRAPQADRDAAGHSKLDVEYVSRRSFGADLVIPPETVPAVFFARSAL